MIIKCDSATITPYNDGFMLVDIGNANEIKTGSTWDDDCLILAISGQTGIRKRNVLSELVSRFDRKDLLGALGIEEPQ